MTFSNPSRIRELDGLRGIAILLVIVFHYFYGNLQPPDGSLPYYAKALMRLTWSGVDLFFVLSGFLIGGILIDAKGSDNFFKTFYIRRTFRIFPLYIAFCLGYFLLLVVTRYHETVVEVLKPPMPWWAYATFTTNIWLSANTSEVFGAALWSLGVEEQFYLTLPLLVYLLPRNRLAPVLLALIVATPVVRMLLMWVRPDLYVHTLVISRADSLLLGVMGALLVRDNAKMEWLTSRRWPLNVTIAVCGSAMCFFLYQNWILGTAGMAYIGYTVLAVFYLALLLAGITRPESRWAWILRNRALRGMGGIAYCAYLMHEPVMAVLFWMNGKYRPSLAGPQDALILVAAFAVTVVVGVLSWRWFEAPLVRMGHRYQYAAVSSPVNSSVKVSAAGS